MSRSPWVLFLILIYLPLSALAQDIGSAVNTDDICSARPDLCQHRPSRNRRHRRAVSTVSPSRRQDRAALESTRPKPKVKKVRRLKDDDEKFMRDFFSKEKNEDEAPFNDAIAQDPSPTRKPASDEALTAPRRKISFSSYLNANSNHPSLSLRYGGRQDAFQEVPRPAVLTAPSSSGVGVSDAPSEEGAGNQSVRENIVPPSNASNRN